MIERPKRSVTRFFVPLIDVLILLFCIFLLMPFVATPAAPEPDPKDKAAPKVKDELPTDVKTLQAELLKSRREVDRLTAERGNLAERLSVKVLEIDPANGRLYYYQDGERVFVPAADVVVAAVAATSATAAAAKRHRRGTGRRRFADSGTASSGSTTSSIATSPMSARRWVWCEPS